LALYDSIYGMIKWLAICTLSTAMISVMMLLVVVMTGNDANHISQNFLTVLYTCCLVGLFCSVVLMWKARWIISNQYTKPYEHFTNAVS
jgi:NhaP-type Na+/H+ or K+/H+ antiporter